ncbi:MAG TPA: hypothetical protein VNA87_03775 [Actinomycetota bacterium]|nr:hypothetical protein [Actinomycetota bacterium]
MIGPEPTPRFADRAVRFFRNHPEAILFLIGLLVFVGGLWSVVGGFFDPAPTGSPAEPNVISSPSDQARVGPGAGVLIGPYVGERRELLAQRAAKKPKTSAFAVVSFGTYKTPQEVDVFMRGNRLEAHELQLRIPLPGFEPQAVRVEGKALNEAVALSLGPERLRELQAELDELEKIIPTVTDADFKATYQADADAHRKAIALLRANAGVVYSVVVKGTYANLAKAQSTAGVRLIDVSDDESSNLETHAFAGLLPEETEKVGLSKP